MTVGFRIIFYRSVTYFSFAINYRFNEIKLIFRDFFHVPVKKIM